MSQENNFIPNQQNYKPLTPFQLFVKSNFPFIENTFEALDNYGLYCKIVEYLNDVINNENTVESNVGALYDAFVSLNTYVSDYFDNLDVQEEINNKLDDMAESGELYDIIKRYTDPIINVQNEQLETLGSRIDNLSSLISPGSTTGDAELIDGRTGYNGEIYSNIGNSIRGQSEWTKRTEKNIDLLTNDFEVYPINRIANWNKVFPVSGEDALMQYLDNGGMIANIQNWTTESNVNTVLSSTLANKTMSLNFDITVIEKIGENDTINVVFQNTIVLKTLYSNNYEIGKRYRINVPIYASSAYRIGFQFVSNLHVKIDNISLTSPITKDFTKYYDIDFGTLNNKIEQGYYINRNMPVPLPNIVSSSYDIKYLYRMSDLGRSITGIESAFTFDNMGVTINLNNWTQNRTLFKANINVNNEDVSIVFNMRVLSHGNGLERFNIVKDLATNLKTIQTVEYELNKDYQIIVPCNNNTGNIRLDILFLTNLHVKLDNLKIVTPISNVDFAELEENSKLIIPSKIPCGINYETNIYYDNILENSYIENIQAVVPSSYFGNTGNSQKERLRIYQSGTNPITSYLSLRTKNNNKQKTVYNYQLIPLNQNIANNKTKKILIIGDSLTQAGVYQTELNRLLESNNFTAEFLGTRGTAPLYNEGRGGWSLKEYCENESYNGITNPFYNNGFDFSYYMTNQSYDSVDYVFINMGTNDMRNENVDTFDYYDEVISSIKEYDENITIFVGIAPPLSSIDIMEMGFYPRNKKLQLAEHILSTYQNKENQGYFIVPFYLNFDAKTQFAKTRITSNRYEDGYCDLINDNTHPTNSGYYRMADTMLYSILYALSLE